MKKILLILSCVAVLASCGSKKGPESKSDQDSTKTSYQYFGDTINDQNVMPGKDVWAFMADKDSAQLKFTGTVTEVCQKKGCWMDVDMGDGKMLTVRFKDYAFFMPKDCSGKTAIMDGYCYKTIETVEWLKHKAKDAGKPQTAIDSITQPDTTYAFEASGVILK